MSIVMRDLQTKAIKNKEAFAYYGMSVFDANGEMRNMADIIENLEVALGGMSDETKKATLLQMGFSDKSLAATMTLIGMSDKIREYERQLRMAAGTTQEVADNMKTVWQKIWAVMSSRSVQAGAAVTSALGSAASSLGQFNGDFIEIAQALWEPWATVWEAIATFTKAVFVNMGITAQNTVASVHDILQGIAFTFRNLSAIVRIHLLDMVIAVLEYFPMMEGPIRGTAAAFIGAWAYVKTFFATIVQNIIGGLQEIWNVFKAVGAGIEAAWSAMMSGDFSGMGTAFGDAFMDEFVNQVDVKAPNAFKAASAAASDAIDKFNADVEKSGGITDHLKGAREGLLKDIAENEAAREMEMRQKALEEATKPGAAAPLPPGAKGGPPAKEEKEELPGMLMRGSAEAWKKIVSSMYGKDKNRAVEKTAANTQRTADALDRIENRPVEEVAI